MAANAGDQPKEQNSITVGLALAEFQANDSESQVLARVDQTL